jgi:Flp pilus assembly pilin Flp
MSDPIRAFVVIVAFPRRVLPLDGGMRRPRDHEDGASYVELHTASRWKSGYRDLKPVPYLTDTAAEKTRRRRNMQAPSPTKGGERMFLALYVGAQSLVTGLRGKLKREDGAVATEYALLLVLIALAIIVAAALLGTAIRDVFFEGADTLEGVSGTPTTP